MERKNSSFNTDSLHLYLKEVNTFKRTLTKQQEYAYIEQYQLHKDIDARNIVITSHLKFVINRAKKFADQTYINIEDLINAGNEALLVAIDKFNTDSGVRFLSYANWWILESFQKVLKESALIRIPHNHVVAFGQIKKAINVSMSSTGEDPSVEVISSISGLSQNQITNTLRLDFSATSLDEVKNNSDGEFTLYNTLADEHSNDPEEQACVADLMASIQIALKFMDPRELQILNSFYGLNNEPQLALDQIASNHNVTPTRIRQVVARNIKRLRHISRNHNLKIYAEERNK